MEGVDEIDRAAPEAEMPKDGGDDELLFFFGAQPLEDESGAKDSGSHKTECGPDFGFDVEPLGVVFEEGAEKAFGGGIGHFEE